MGYQRLRLMPYLHPNAWRLAVAPKELFSDRNGAFVPHGKLGDCSVAIYSAAGGGDGYFDWTDVRGDDTGSG